MVYRSLLFACFLSFVFFLLIFIAAPVEAKILPQARGAKQITVTRSTASGITVSPKLRGDRQALVVNFSNLQNAKSVSYTLIYNTNGQGEGAGGTLSSLSGAQTRELLFGTCSKNVCRYHTNITNMRFEIISDLKSGKKTLKRYRIRI